MSEEKKKVGDKAAVEPKPVLSTSIKSLKMDLALVNFLHDYAISDGGPTRMKTIMAQEQFRLFSEVTIRRHLQSLCTRSVLEEDKLFRGSYRLVKAGYDTWVRDLSKYLKEIVGPELFKTIVDSLRPLPPR